MRNFLLRFLPAIIFGCAFSTGYYFAGVHSLLICTMTMAITSTGTYSTHIFSTGKCLLPVYTLFSLTALMRDPLHASMRDPIFFGIFEFSVEEGHAWDVFE